MGKLYIKTKNYIIDKDDVIEIREFGDKTRITYLDSMKNKANAKKYEAKMFVNTKDLNYIEMGRFDK